MTLDELSRYQGTASELVLYDEVGDDTAAADALRDLMRSRIGEMRDAIARGLATTVPSSTGMVGWNAKTLHDASDSLSSPLVKRVQSYALAVNEQNARRGRID